MKKSTLMKWTFLFVAIFAFTSTFAQVAGTDYAQYDANLTAPTTIDYVTLKAPNTIMGYYAKPDPAYHAGYVTPGWALTADFVWNWVNTVNPGTAATFAKTGAANYVEVTYAQLGNYTITVAEQASPAFGGCVDASPTVMNVTVVAPPTGTTSIAPVGWQQITLNQSYQICGTQLAQTVTVAFNEAIPNALASYAFQVTEMKETIDGSGANLTTPQAETVVQDFPLTTKLKGTNLGTLPGAAFATATPAFTFTFNTDALVILQTLGVDARTRYTYKVTRTGDVAQNGFVSNISHKSDYLGAVNYYNFTNQTVTFIINPTPSTGPIYHIPNNFRL
ncbi:MAG: hypothetical protein AB9846_05870 [Tenuifilaceae bacterium]